MFSGNKMGERGAGTRVYVICGVIHLLLICFWVNAADAASLQAAYKYQEIKKISKDSEKKEAPGDLEKLVAKSRAFISTYPEYKRVDQVHYLLGNALVGLGKVEEGIEVFEKAVEAHPEARYTERCLLALGLAYDKLGDHEAADAAYQKLVAHPTFGSRSQAKHAKKILEQDKASRNGELTPPSMRMLGREWIGKEASNFEVKNLAGETISLEKYRGQVVLLDFWATWCPPCIAEIPNLKKTYQKYKDQKFEIIGISLDRSLPPLSAYIEKEELGWVHYWDGNRKVSSMYKVQAIPSTFLIDGEGIIRKTNLRGHALEHAIEELFQENITKPDPPAKVETENEEFKRLRTQATNAFNAEQFEQAIELYTSALEMRPDNADIYNDLGSVYYEQGLKYAGPSWPSWEKDLGEASVDPAIAELKTAIDKTKSGAIVLMTRDKAVADAVEAGAKALDGRVYRQRWENEITLTILIGQTKTYLQRAHDHYIRALDLKPTHSVAYRNLGSFYMKVGDTNEALNHYEKSIELDPSDTELQEYLYQFRQ